MKCSNCDGLGYIVTMRPLVFGQPIEPPPECERCEGKGVIPDPVPVPFRSRVAAARKRRRP
jgi:DnaJ-class molecular chaperone